METAICKLYFLDEHEAPLVQNPNFRNSLWGTRYFLNPNTSFPMPMISFSNCILQYLCDLRDSILAARAHEMGGIAKIGCVTLISLTACIGYTVLNVAETTVRAIAAVVFLAVFGPLLLIASCFDIDKKGDLYENIDSCYDIGLAGFLGAVQGALQIASGFFASYAMATHTGLSMPKADEITNTASFGLSKAAVVALEAWIDG